MEVASHEPGRFAKTQSGRHLYSNSCLGKCGGVGRRIEGQSVECGIRCNSEIADDGIDFSLHGHVTGLAWRLHVETVEYACQIEVEPDSC